MGLCSRSCSIIMLNKLRPCHIYPVIKTFTTRTTSSPEYNQNHRVIPTFRYALSWPDKIAIKDQYGFYTYRGIFNGSKQLADDISKCVEGNLQERIAFLCPNNASYVVTQWACWMSGQIAVPLSPAHPSSMLEYFITDSDARILIATKEYIDILQPISIRTGRQLIILDDSLWHDAMLQLNDKLDEFESHTSEKISEKVNLPSLIGGLNPNMYNKLNAMILYTSGSTAAPKGVVLSYLNLAAQTNSLMSAWNWSENDVILHTLPLHHMHGVVNALLCPLQSGAKCIMLPKFDAASVWDHLLSIKQGIIERTNIFMGVPTMYVKLIEQYEKSINAGEIVANFVKASCSQKIRLMVSGSAPLPDTVFDKWKQITGHSLLERYGMSEIGMALSNPLNGQRKPGFVGIPLPGISVRITNGNTVLVEGNERGTKVITSTVDPKETANVGELQIKGDNVFKEYWRKPEATAKEFTLDGWFKTGDTAQFIDDSYKILGRSSVDIIKSGGYKISALFVETALLEHPNIKDISVVGLPDSTWGQNVAAVIVTKDGTEITLASLKEWAKNKIPPYTIPSILKIVPQIPRNLMGKVNKKHLINEIFANKTL